MPRRRKRSVLRDTIACFIAGLFMGAILFIFHKLEVGSYAIHTFLSILIMANLVQIAILRNRLAEIEEEL
jgi:hypothetical protein